LSFTSGTRPNLLLLWPTVNEGDGVCICIIDSMTMEWEKWGTQQRNGLQCHFTEEHNLLSGTILRHTFVLISCRAWHAYLQHQTYYKHMHLVSITNSTLLWTYWLESPQKDYIIQSSLNSRHSPLNILWLGPKILG
jgi:hypothetical protein